MHKKTSTADSIPHSLFEENSSDKGFTLIELIVVMAIIAILVLLAAPRFLGYTKDANASAIKQDTKVLSDAAEMYHIDNDEWPIQPDVSGEPKITVTPKSGKGAYEAKPLDKDKLSSYVKSTKNDIDEHYLLVGATSGNNVYEGHIIRMVFKENGTLNKVEDKDGRIIYSSIFDGKTEVEPTVGKTIN